MAASRFVWFELCTDDPAAAVDFYRSVVGWGARDAGVGAGPYTLLTVGEAPVAGVMAMPEELARIGRRPAWSGYVAVGDCAAASARVLALGGRVLRPAADIPDVGTFAVVADPQGAEFMLFTPRPGDAAASAPAGAAGTVGWLELQATDAGTALDFYVQAFGWTAGDTLDTAEPGGYRMFKVDGVHVGGVVARPADQPAPAWRFYVNVDDADAAATRLRERGGRVTGGPMTVGGGSRVLTAVDPQGAAFALVSAPRAGPGARPAPSEGSSRPAQPVRPKSTPA